MSWDQCLTELLLHEAGFWQKIYGLNLKYTLVLGIRQMKRNCKSSEDGYFFNIQNSVDIRSLNINRHFN
jgi:hypothetical protein